MKRTEVVNIRYAACDVYIGRAGRGEDGYFRNPFRLLPGMSRGAALDRYRSYFYGRLRTDPEFRQRIHALKGKRLGCFCKPYPCHRDIIKEYQGYHIDLARDLYLYMYLNNPQEDETIHMTVERDGKDVELAFKPDVQVRYLLGFNRKSTDSLEVASLIPGMGLSETGVEPGDVITSINGTRLESSDDYTAYLAEHPLTSEPVTITYERDGLEYNAEVTPSESRTAVLDFSYNLAYTKTHGFEVLKYGTLEVKYMIRSTLLSLKELLTGGLGVKDLSGPVGVVDAIGSTYEASKSEGMLTIWVNMLYMAALLSANLGVMNLLPLPALDGGRLVFLIIEAIRRKPVNRQIEGMVHFAGLMVLMLLMVVVMYNDILKIF